MVKLATARDSRIYGGGRSRGGWEYVNAGLYAIAAVLLLAGLASQLPAAAAARGAVNVAGMVVVLAALVLVAVVNAHDLFAHMAAVDCRLALIRYDLQLGLVEAELAVPALQLLGTILFIIGALLLISQQGEEGYSYSREKHAVNLLIAGPVLWLLGSIHNTCQVYERADGHTQILQAGVHVPFLLGSLLFLVGGFFNRHYVFDSAHRDLKIMAKSWVWFCVFGSLLFLIGGLVNLLKVYKMQQTDGLRLEKLRGGAQERLSRHHEGRVPLNWEETAGAGRAAVAGEPRAIP
uniref:Uncharacterized protein n=1 Tax=Ananas comosus var. bracteatus TaxID=296719 RepID=A0A6V7NZM8_ANACO|nr:unnamed protein product [Ananas comosus var. bracteatus]